MRTFCRGGNLKAMLGEWKDTDDDALAVVKDAFGRCFPTEFKGTLKTDLIALGADGEQETRPVWDVNHAAAIAPNAAYAALSARIDAESPNARYTPGVQERKRVKVGGLDFTHVKESKGNAQILFRPTQEGVGEVAAGQIDSIFVHQHTPAGSDELVAQHFFIVRKYKNLEDPKMARDPYRRYPLLDVWACYDAFEEEPFAVKGAEIVSHAATCPIELSGEKYRVVLSLDRVSGLRTPWLSCHS